MRITKIGSPVVRETAIFERTNALIVTLYPRHIEIRLKGQRDSVSVDYGEVLELARRLPHNRSARR